MIEQAAPRFGRLKVSAIFPDKSNLKFPAKIFAWFNRDDRKCIISLIGGTYSEEKKCDCHN